MAVDAMGDRMVPTVEAMDFSGAGIIDAAVVMTVLPMLPTLERPAFTADPTPESLEEMPSLIPAKALLMPFDALVA